MPRTIVATRYVTPLREGGSLPAIVEAEDAGLYVVKFRGAGQGAKALIAEYIAAELARAAGLRVPEMVLMELDPALGRNEPDSEIRGLIKASEGLNLALDYLPGSVTFDPVAGPAPTAAEASAIVAFDAFITNVDRTPKNPNLLCWHRELWLIDHGASLYFHHAWVDWEERSQGRFAPIKDHVLLPWASLLPQAEATLRGKLTREVVEATVNGIPEGWLGAAESPFPTVEAHRAAYVTWLLKRVEALPAFIEEAARARAQLV
ncbi:HipA family kinase [Myxococcus landrumensis]|uniref:Aminotransferase class I and II n=1 Tax=Myxococcus landrumensis TaxID=2813577 RepID=A0ABX7MY34_9BACT|nr:HipA family kinase [Myxococcus landrumus]QSQ11336.1 aminotransferase class I and II [Myxococcus landrumus]